MAVTTVATTQCIKNLHEKLCKAEAKAIKSLIDAARQCTRRRESVAPDRWEEALASSGVDTQEVEHYLTVGSSWWATAPPGTDDLARLPFDLGKLAMLCRLSQEQLGDLLTTVNVRIATREEVAAIVAEVLGPSSASLPAHDANDESVAER
jgi:hypothetical protein